MVFFGVGGSVSLKKTYTLPSIDEKLGEEDGSLKERMMPWLSVGSILVR